MQTQQPVGLCQFVLPQYTALKATSTKTLSCLCKLWYLFEWVQLIGVMVILVRATASLQKSSSRRDRTGRCGTSGPTLEPVDCSSRGNSGRQAYGQGFPQ